MSLTPFQLRLIRDRLGITQPDAGQLIGASLGWVRHLEQGHPRGVATARMLDYERALLALATERGTPVHDITGAK